MNITLIKIFSFRRYKRTFNSFIFQIIPREIFNPRVFFYFFRSIDSESVQRFPLDHLINKVSSLEGPALRNIISLNLYLLGKDVVSDFLPALADVGPLGEHAFEGNHAEGEVIRLDSVVLATHDFGGHVPGSSGSVLGVLRTTQLRDSVVSYS